MKTRENRKGWIGEGARAMLQWHFVISTWSWWVSDGTILIGQIKTRQKIFLRRITVPLLFERNLEYVVKVLVTQWAAMSDYGKRFDSKGRFNIMVEASWVLMAWFRFRRKAKPTRNPNGQVYGCRQTRIYHQGMWAYSKVGVICSLKGMRQMQKSQTFHFDTVYMERICLAVLEHTEPDEL